MSWVKFWTMGCMCMVSACVLLWVSHHLKPGDMAVVVGVAATLLWLDVRMDLDRSLEDEAL